jgi:hypothetical protein
METPLTKAIGEAFLTRSTKGQNTMKSEYSCKICGAKFTGPKAQYSLATHVRVDHKKDRVKKLTPSELLAKFPQEVAECVRLGTGTALARHPEWMGKLLANGEPKQTLYLAVSYLKHGKTNTYNPAPQETQAQKPARRRKGKNIVWTEEQAQLVRQILNAPQWRKNGNRVAWEIVFATHPEWGQALNFNSENDKKLFRSFSKRVADGKVKFASAGDLAVSTRAPEEVHAEPVNGAPTSVQIGGRNFTLLELEQIVRASLTALKPLKWCPECGYGLVFHTKAYSFAVKHSHNEPE